MHEATEKNEFVYSIFAARVFDMNIENSNENRMKRTNEQESDAFIEV